MEQGLKEVNGFSFSGKDGKLAEKELSAIKYIDQQIRGGDITKLYNLYRSLVEQHFFQTAVGYDYLRTLQKYLMNSDEIDSDQVPPIPVDSYYEKEPLVQESRKAPAEPVVKQPEKVNTKQIQALENDVAKYRSRFHYALIICVVFLVTIGGMFFILSTTDSPTIINYENKIIDKYSSWEEELNARELEINERERALENNSENN